MKPAMTPLVSRIVAGGTVVAAVAVLFGPRVLAVPAGLLLAFALPGFALTEVLFRSRVLTAVERTVLTPALSLAVLVASGLVVYVLGVPLDRTSWTVATAGSALAALAVWTVLEQRGKVEPESPTQVIPAVRIGGGAAPSGALPDAVRQAEKQAHLAVERVRQAEQRAERRRQQRRAIREFVPLLAVVAVLAGAGWLSFQSSYDSYEVTVTALSAAPPGPVGATGDRVVEVTASGLLPGDGPYTLTVAGDGGSVQPRRTVVVPPDGVWRASLSVPADERTTIGLYRASDAGPYRTVLIAAVR